MARYDVEQRCTRSGTVRIRAASPTVTSFPLSIWCHRLLRLPHFPLNRASGRVTVGLTHSRLTPPGLDALTSTLPCESLAGCSGLAGLDAQPSAYAVRDATHPPPTPMSVALLITQPREIRDATQARWVIAILARTESRNRLAIPIGLLRPRCPARLHPLFLPGGGSCRFVPSGSHDIPRAVASIPLIARMTYPAQFQHSRWHNHISRRIPQYE